MKELGAGRGAEELTRQLNGVYDALIAEVHRHQGSVISFSGDAITCWFDDDPSTLPTVAGQAGLRATVCALNMQQVMTRFAEMKTPSGILVSLGLKAAVTAGSVRRFLIGNPQIQYVDVLAGMTVDRVAEAEGYAEKGQVVVGSEVISQSGDNVEIVKWRGDKRFAIVTDPAQATLVETAPWPALPVGALTEEQTRSWILPPVYERLKTERGEFLAELRPGVALFLKFGGIDYDQDDAAEEKLDAYIREVQNILHRYESYLLQLTIGDKGSCRIRSATGPRR
jgi:class 3 adenylate cyclase